MNITQVLSTDKGRLSESTGQLTDKSITDLRLSPRNIDRTTSSDE